MVGIERGDPLRPPGPERLLPRGQRRVPSPVPQPQRAFVAPAAQLGHPELADGVQQPVPGRAVPLAEQDRLGHQRVDQVGDLARRRPGPPRRPPRPRPGQTNRRTPTPAATWPAPRRSAGHSSTPAPPAASGDAAGRPGCRRTATGTASPAGTGSAPATATAAGPRPARPPAGSRPAPGTPPPPPEPLPASTVNPGNTAAARSANNRTASYRSSSAGPDGSPSAGTVIGGTAIVTSPATPSTCRLVAMIRSPGHPRSSASAITAHASARCSHPSSTSSTCRFCR